MACQVLRVTVVQSFLVTNVREIVDASVVASCMDQGTGFIEKPETLSAEPERDQDAYCHASDSFVTVDVERTHSPAAAHRTGKGRSSRGTRHLSSLPPCAVTTAFRDALSLLTVALADLMTTRPSQILRTAPPHALNRVYPRTLMTTSPSNPSPTSLNPLVPLVQSIEGPSGHPHHLLYHIPP